MDKSTKGNHYAPHKWNHTGKRRLISDIASSQQTVVNPGQIIINVIILQVNYFKDHTKLIVGGERQFVVTYINSERQSRSWSLADLARKGASAQVRERMTYVASVLEEFAELDEQGS